MTDKTYNDFPFVFDDRMHPFDEDGNPLIHHLDKGGTHHWFAVVESGAETQHNEDYELRYYRAFDRGDGKLRYDSYPVMPLPEDDPALAWMLPGLEMYLEQGDLERAQRLAFNVAAHHRLEFPDPLDLPVLNVAPHFFTEGHPDRFSTLHERELNGEFQPSNALLDNRNISEDDTKELPTSIPELGSWEELIEHSRQQDVQSVETDASHPYWQLHTRQVETMEGQKLGEALFVTIFPELPADFDQYVETNGMDDTMYPTHARTLEIAHFTSEAERRSFSEEFMRFVIPGVMEGPELSEEVAKLEGMSGQWIEMDQRAIVDYMSGKRTIVRDTAEWRPHDPMIERDARLQMEGTPADPIQGFAQQDELDRENRVPDLDF